MKNLFKFAAATLAMASMVAACEKNGGDPEVPGTPLDNEIEFAGVRAEIKTVLVDATTEQFYFSTEAGVQSYDQLLGTEYVTFVPGDNAEGTEDGTFETSLTDLPEGFEFAYFKGGEQVLALTSDDHSAITEGSFKMTLDMETFESAVVEFSMTLTSGETFSGNMDITSDVVPLVPDMGNTISVNGTVDPVRKAFYLDDAENGYVSLYLTSGDVYDLDDMLENAVNYFCVMLSEDDLTGEEIDIATTDKFFYVLLQDNITTTTSYATLGDSEGAAGTVSVSRSASDPTGFTANVAVTFADGNEVVASFEGQAVSGESVDEPEQPNEFTHDGMTEPIQSALVDTSDPDIWHIWMSTFGGLESVSEYEDPYYEAVHITAPAEAFNAGPAGFSTYKGILKFEYAGNTWEWKDDGSVTGTLEAWLEDGQLTVDFTDYNGFEGHYSGPATVVE